MRAEFHNRLDALTSDLAQMCRSAAEAMQNATVALLDLDAEMALHVHTDVEALRAVEGTVEKHALTLLACQSPVAGDLRAVFTALQIAADASRMGALAAHVAATALRRHPHPALPGEVQPTFAAMGRVAVNLTGAAAQVVLDGDPVRADQIRADDRAMNELHRALFTMVLDPRWRHGISTATDVVLLGRFYERFADHAAEIARRVVFRTTGIPLIA